MNDSHPRSRVFRCRDGNMLLRLLDEEEDRRLAEEHLGFSRHDIDVNWQEVIDQFNDDELRSVLTKIPIQPAPNLADRVAATEKATRFYKWHLGGIGYTYHWEKQRRGHKNSSKKTTKLLERIDNDLTDLIDALRDKRWYRDIVPYLRLPIENFIDREAGFGFSARTHPPEARDRAHNSNALRYIFASFRLELRLMSRMVRDANTRRSKHASSPKPKRNTPLTEIIGDLVDVYEGRAHEWALGKLNDVAWPVVMNRGIRHAGRSAHHEEYEGPFLDCVREFLRIIDPPEARRELGRTVWDAVKRVHQERANKVPL